MNVPDFTPSYLGNFGSRLLRRPRLPVSEYSFSILRYHKHNNSCCCRCPHSIPDHTYPYLSHTDFSGPSRIREEIPGSSQAACRTTAACSSTRLRMHGGRQQGSPYATSARSKSRLTILSKSRLSSSSSSCGVSSTN